MEAVARKNGKELRDMIRIDFKLIPDDLKMETFLLPK